MQITAINGLTSGIDRLRWKGGASPKGLYDLLNGYVTLSGSIESRPGTAEDATLPSGTHGLCAFDGALVVFAIEPKSCPAGYSCEVLVNPNDATSDIAEIHYAGPFLGYLYVVVEFDDGNVWHYWLEGSSSANDWQADHIYGLNEIVTPGNGLAYRATRLNPADQPWQANEPHTVGDVREPTVFNKFKYEVIDTTGTNPTSGATEPAWKAEDGAVVYEESDIDTSDVQTPDGDPTTPDTTLPPDVIDRYKPGQNTTGGAIP